MAQQTTGDDIGDVVRSWLRWSWLAVVLGLAGFLIAGLVEARLSGGGESEARAVVGLTEAAEWPLYDSIVARGAGFATDRSVTGPALDAAGVDPSQITVEATAEEGRIAVIRTRGPSGSAADAAGVIAEAVVATIEGEIVANLETDRSTLEALIPPVETEIERISAEISTLNGQIDQIEGEERQTLRVQVDLLEDTLNTQSSILSNRRRDLAEIDQELQTRQPVVEIAENAGTVGTSSALRSASVLGALLGALAALSIAPAADRLLGKVQTSRHGELNGLADPWINVGGRGLLAIDDPGAALASAVRQGETVAVISLSDSERAAQATGAIRESLGDRVVDGGSIDDPRAAIAVTGADVVVLLISKGKSSRRRTRAALERLHDLQVTRRIPVLLST